MIKLLVLFASFIPFTFASANQRSPETCREEFLKETKELLEGDAPKITLISEFKVLGKNSQIYKLKFASENDPQMVLLLDSESVELNDCHTEPLPSANDEGKNEKNQANQGTCLLQAKKSFASIKAFAHAELSLSVSITTSGGALEIYQVKGIPGSKTQMIAAEATTNAECTFHPFSY